MRQGQHLFFFQFQLGIFTDIVKLTIIVISECLIIRRISCYPKGHEKSLYCFKMGFI